MNKKASFLIILLLILNSATSYAQEKKLKKEEKQTITITAVTASGNPEKNIAIYKGNVTVKRGDTTLKAAELIAHLNIAKGKDPKSSENLFKKIIAKGNVIMKSEDKIATAEKAVYIADKEELTLTGTNKLTGERPKIGYKDNYTYADKIVYSLKTKDFQLSGLNGKQVIGVYTNN